MAIRGQKIEKTFRRTMGMNFSMITLEAIWGVLVFVALEYDLENKKFFNFINIWVNWYQNILVQQIWTLSVDLK